MHEIRLIVDTDDNEVLAQLEAAIEKAVCPHDPAEDHACPHRWMLMRSELDDDEAAGWLDELNE